MKRFSFDKKTVILTGASSGIGKEIAKVLISKYGCTVYAIARNEEKLRSVGRDISDTLFIPCPFDVGVYENWTEFAKNLEECPKKPDILINCAGVLPKFASVQKTDKEVFESVLRTDFLAQVYSCKVFLPIIKSSGGAIVNVSSSSSLCPFAGVAAYSSSKAASERFTECLAEENRDILISSVLPGFVKTDIMRNQASSEKERRIISKVSADCHRTVKKILRRVRRRKKRIIVGADAHFMNFAFKFFPSLAPKIITGVLKRTKFSLFADI